MGAQGGRVLEKDRHATTKPKRREARRTRRPAWHAGGVRAYDENRHRDAHSPHPVHVAARALRQLRKLTFGSQFVPQKSRCQLKNIAKGRQRRRRLLVAELLWRVLTATGHALQAALLCAGRRAVRQARGVGPGSGRRHRRGHSSSLISSSLHSHVTLEPGMV